MKPPKCSSIQELNTILLKMGEMEGGLSTLKEQLRTIPKRMARELKTDHERLEAARYLYWYMPDIATGDIAEGLLGADIKGINIHSFLERIGAITVDVICDRCEKQMVCRSRQHMQELVRNSRSEHPRYSEGYRVLCESCWGIVQQERMQERR